MPVPASTLAAARPEPGALVRAINDDPTALVYFLVNVGDGDTQLLLLPPDSTEGVRRLVIVDVATAGKLPALIGALHKAQLIEEPPAKRQIRLLVATHPHYDHIGGMSDVLAQYNGTNRCIEEFWDPGYYFPNPSFHNVMRELETSPWIRRLQPTAGTVLYLDSVKLTVLGPGVGLRNRFDTYGVGVNDASITLMIDYPATDIFTESEPGRRNRRSVRGRTRRLLLGGDAQFTSWAQTTVDFPELQQQQNSALAQELRAARGKDYLKSDVLKVAHHASKHGVNLELLERIGASLTFVSSVAGGGRYGFPHLLAMEAAREARQATATRGPARRADSELGIHVTGGRLDTGQPCGSIALIVPRAPSAHMRMFRLMDRPDARIRLINAREVRL